MSSPAENPGSPAPVSATPTRSVRRAQTAIDSVAALMLTMLVWPFPLARAALAPLVNVACILVLWQVLQVAYFTITMAVWGATGGTRVMGLRVMGTDGEAASRRQRAIWGALSGVIAVARIIAPPRSPAQDMPERIAGVTVLVYGLDSD
jgi:uncharacterized RDD family membrane protein YckC